MGEITTMTLQTACLDKIISEFGWFYQAYRNTTDYSFSSLKFEFLKRNFSLDIIQKLNKEEQLKTEYLDFLINKYLKVLDTGWLRTWPCESVAQKLAEIGTNLEDVTFSDGRPWDEIVCYLPNMKKVTFQHHCTDEFLVNLSKFCGCIEILDVSHSRRVSDSGLMKLCTLDKNPSYSYLPIKELIISRTVVDDEGVVHVLKNMPNLEKIDYKKLPDVLYSMHKSDINAFDKVKPYNLTHLNLADKYYGSVKFLDRFNDILKVCVFVCPHLKSLYCLIHQKQHLDLCSQLQELEKLGLYCNRNELPLELNEMLTTNGKNLTSLEIEGFCISLSVLAQNCPRLKSLMMDQVLLQHNVNDYVPVFHNLEKVIFLNVYLTESAFSQAVTCLLASVPNLNELYFTYSKLVFSDIKAQILKCCEQCKLSIMDFCFTKMEFTLLKDILLTCSSLKILRLDHVSIEPVSEELNELKTFATSLPNNPQVYFEEYDDSTYIQDEDDDLF